MTLSDYLVVPTTSVQPLGHSRYTTSTLPESNHPQTPYFATTPLHSFLLPLFLLLLPQIEKVGERVGERVGEKVGERVGKRVERSVGKRVERSVGKKVGGVGGRRRGRVGHHRGQGREKRREQGLEVGSSGVVVAVVAVVVVGRSIVLVDDFVGRILGEGDIGGGVGNGKRGGKVIVDCCWLVVLGGKKLLVW